MRQIDYQRQKRALVGMFVIMRQFIMRYGCAKFRMIIKMAMHMQMAFTIISISMFMDMNMDTAAIHRPDQLRAKISDQQTGTQFQQRLILIAQSLPS